MMRNLQFSALAVLVCGSQGRPLGYLPEATGPRDVFDTQR
jgi:hypothetical protein